MAKCSTLDFHDFFSWDFFRVIASLPLFIAWYCLQPKGLRPHGAGAYLYQMEIKSSKNKQQGVEQQRSEHRIIFVKIRVCGRESNGDTDLLGHRGEVSFDQSGCLQMASIPVAYTSKLIYLIMFSGEKTKILMVQLIPSD